MSRFIVSPHAQQTPGWFTDRLGKLTGSKCKAIVAQRGEREGRETLRLDLVLERITGIPAKGPRTTDEMRHGILNEPIARSIHEEQTGLSVYESGFMYLPRLKAGGSVDGVLTDDDGRKGISEYKCPGMRAHCRYINAGVLPAEHAPQVIHNLWVTGYAFCDFQSYCPSLPENLQVFRLRVERDQKVIDAYERTAMQFLMECDDLEDQYRQRAA